jgi:multiple sugar transport system permease protein
MMATTTAPARPVRAPVRRRSAARARTFDARRYSLPARVAMMTVLAVLAALWLTPLAWALLTSLKHEADTTRVPIQVLPAHGFTLDAYRAVLAEANVVVTWFVNSTVISVIVTALTVAVSAAAAYGFSRMEFPGRRALFALTIAGIMVPPQVLIVPLYRQMLTFGLADTYPGIFLSQLVIPAMVFILKKFFDGLPRELEEAARVDGAGSLRIFLRIVPPLSGSILAAVSIFVFISTWNNFLWPFIITSNPGLMTLPVGLVQVQSSFGVRYAQIMAAAILAGLPLIVVFMLFQRQIVRGVATTGLAGT